MELYKTGQKAPHTDIYEYVKSVDNKVSCEPTNEEKIIPLSKDETFPPVKSCGKDGGAYWKQKNT